MELEQSKPDLASCSWRWAWDPLFDPPFRDWLTRPSVDAWRPKNDLLQCTVCSEVCVFRITIKWKCFATSNVLREIVRRIVSCYANEMNAQSVLYLPDSYWPAAEGAVSLAAEGWTFEKILAYLNSEIQITGNWGCKFSSVNVFFMSERPFWGRRSEGERSEPNAAAPKRGAARSSREGWPVWFLAGV